jgi:fused signal recognition particle receptor
VNQGADTSAGNRGWLARLKAGLARSSGKLGDGISGIFTKRRLDDAALEELEELLISADLGVATAAKLAAGLARERFDKDVSPEEVRVNGSGKTTTIGKIAKTQSDQGYKVMLAAGDTFRAAAIDQLRIWGERTSCEVVARAPGADAAGLAYEALERARADDVDLLLIDTAGRLHNKADLMAELQKIIRVLKKLDPEAPHDCLLVLDATTGQNAHAQVETFKELVQVTGLIVTKLDGSARGGVLVALAERFGLPVHAIGVGESAEDLRPFAARDFARSLMGLDA